MSPTPDAPTPVGQQLADRRDELDLTQEALARLIGITSATVSATERGKTEISRTKRPAWERALNLKPGTIARAYREGAAIEPVATTDQTPYADLTDPHERAIWEMNLSEDDRREMIRLMRLGREQEHRRGA